MQPFVHLSIMFWLYTVLLQYQSSKSLNLLVFHNSGAISLRLAAFLFLIFVSPMLNSSWVNCPSLMSSWLLIIFLIGLSVTLGNFLIRFLKMLFSLLYSFFLVGSFLALEVLFLLTSSTVCHAIRDCLSSTEFLIDLTLNIFYLFFLLCIN